MISKSEHHHNCRYTAKKHRRVVAVTLMLILILSTICFVFIHKALSPLRVEPKNNSAVVILDDGCPNPSSAAHFRVTCTTTSGATGQGVHSSMLLKTLVNIDNNINVPFHELIFINIADTDSKSSKSAIAEGLRLAQELDPLAINLSYSLSQQDIEIENLLQDLASNDIKIFAAYSNLFFEEESFPASSSSTIGVKIGERTTRRDDNNLMIESELVENISQEHPSTSAASIIALAFDSICSQKPQQNAMATKMCPFF